MSPAIAIAPANHAAALRALSGSRATTMLPAKGSTIKAMRMMFCGIIGCFIPRIARHDHYDDRLIDNKRWPQIMCLPTNSFSRRDERTAYLLSTISWRSKEPILPFPVPGARDRREHDARRRE